MIHDLKIEGNYLKNLLSGIKKVEIRRNDREYNESLLPFRSIERK